MDEKKENNEFFMEEYLKPKTSQPRFWISIGIFIIIIVSAFIFKKTVLDTAVNPKELISAIEFFELDSQWVQKKKVNTKEFKGVILVPQMSFRIRNIGKIELENVFILGVFRLLNRAKPLGEGFEMTLKKPLKPGETSDRIVLTCQFGIQTASKEEFKNSKKDWRTSMVELFAKSKGTNLLFLKSFYISRRIEGMNMDIQLTNKPIDELIKQKKEIN